MKEKPKVSVLYRQKSIPEKGEEIFEALYVLSALPGMELVCSNMQSSIHSLCHYNGLEMPEFRIFSGVKSTSLLITVHDSKTMDSIRTIFNRAEEVARAVTGAFEYEED